MNEKGGINDDCIVTRDDTEKFFVVLNAGCKDKDLEHMRSWLQRPEWKGKNVNIEYNEDNSLVAV
jgi:aminomethyltransferase